MQTPIHFARRIVASDRGRGQADEKRKQRNGSWLHGEFRCLVNDAISTCYDGGYEKVDLLVMTL